MFSSSTTSNGRSISGLDLLAQGAAYADANQHSAQPANVPRNPPRPELFHGGRSSSQRKRPASDAADAGSRRRGQRGEDGKPAVRRRITRACDRCNTLRTKCDGSEPCQNCTETGLSCEYKRALKKRGKASARERTQAGGGQNDDNTAQGLSQAASSPRDRSRGHERDEQPSGTTESSEHATAPVQQPVPNGHQDGQRHDRQPSQHPRGSFGAVDGHTDGLSYNSHLPGRPPLQSFASMPGFVGTGPLATPDYRDVQGFPISNVHGAYPGNGFEAFDNVTRAPTSTGGLHFNGSIHHGSLQGVPNPQRRVPHGDAAAPLPSGASNNGEESLSGWLNGLHAAQSSGRFSIPSMPSPGATAFAMPSMPQQDGVRQLPSIKYPVLRPVLPYIAPIIPISLACELLDLCFASTTSAFQHPSSPYVLGFVFRKRSFLHPTHPRICSPALLASMLWIAAQTSDAPFPTASIAARGKVCQKLLELTINLLKPLVHQPNSGDDPSVTVINGVALAGFGVNVNLPLPGARHGSDVTQYAAQSSTAEVDDIATYIHLATVISASEYKAASMRWWSVVYTLAHELRFSKELPRPPEDAHNLMDSNEHDVHCSTTAGPSLSEESREERRRVWWLTYIVDRHLALCYNQPLSLLDTECMGLLRPVPEQHWQAGDTYLGPPAPDSTRPRGVTLELTDHSIFGFFTPLMTLLGEAVELQQARMHPRLGLGFRPAHEFDDMADRIRGHAETFRQSIAAFRAANLPEHLLHDENSTTVDGATAPSSKHAAKEPLTEHAIQTIIVTAYSTYIQHVLLILLSGKWDPLTLLDDADLWISPPAFPTSTHHALSATHSLDPILDYDPDLSFMPWFYGIYLLQGSFLLLLFADKLGAEAGERYVGACERSVRAVESCVVTLATEYQRNFRRVLRSALAQVRGRVPVDGGDGEAGTGGREGMRRREVLALYRWTGEGRGLAL